MNYKVMLAKILSEKELADMDIKKIKEDDALLEELIRKEYALVVDWSGEEGDNYLFNFFNQRTISLLGKQLDISSNEVYQQFDKDIDTPKRGDFVPFALEYFDKHLKSNGLRVVLLDMCNDAYYVFVAPKTDANRLTKIKSTFWKFKLVSFQKLQFALNGIINILNQNDYQNLYELCKWLLTCSSTAPEKVG